MTDRELIALALGVLTHPKCMMRLEDGRWCDLFARSDIANLAALFGRQLGLTVSEDSGAAASAVTAP